MGGRIIHQHDHRAAQMPQQLAEKDANLLLPDVIEVQLIVQAQALSPRTYRNPGNDGDLVPPTLAVNSEPEDTLVGTSSVRNQQKARFVGKD